MPLSVTLDDVAEVTTQVLNRAGMRYGAGDMRLVSEVLDLVKALLQTRASEVRVAAGAVAEGVLDLRGTQFQSAARPPETVSPTLPERLVVKD